MTTNHTPGPWRIVGGTEVRGGGTIICNTADYRVPNPDLEAVASPDARLIAAAPDLLAALEELIAEWDATHADEDHRTGYTLDTGGIRMARDAIARATGADQ